MSPDKTPSQKKTSLQQWLKRKKGATKKSTVGIGPKPAESPALLSYGQQRLWFLQQLHPENPFYHYAHRYALRGPMDLGVLQKSWQTILQRHAILRTTFRENNGALHQVIHPELETPWEVIDFRTLDKTQHSKQIEQEIKANSTKPFDLSEGPLIRIRVFVLEEDYHVIVLTIHHIIGDRWSLGVLNREWAAAYTALIKQEPPQLEPLSFQYLDYAYWQRQQKVKDADLAYWEKQLAGELPMLDLPTDYARPDRPTYRGGILAHAYSPTLSKQLKALCQEHSATLFVVLLAAFKILLYRYTGQRDVLVGAPFSNRDQTSLEKLIGFFNETLVLRSDLSEDLSFLQLVEQLKQTTIDAFAHKNVPFETLVRRLNADRSGAVNPLFQVMFLYNKALTQNHFSEELLLEDSSIDLEISKFDLSLFIIDHNDHLEAIFEYTSDLFEAATIQRMQQHLQFLLEQIVVDPQQNISSYSLLSDVEKKEVVEDWNRNTAPLPEVHSIHELIEQHAAQKPDRVAVIYEEDQLTYQELNQKANALAYQLIENGIQKGDFVGIYCRRSVEMMVAILGILKSGAAYLPLDPDYPEERITYMLDHAAAKMVVVQKALDFTLTKAQVASIPIEQERVLSNFDWPQVEREDLAYIIYTSGSTGQPKGVAIRHGNLIHSTVARFHFYPDQPGCFLLLSSFSFDSSVAGIFWSVCSGGTLLLPRKRIEQDLDALAVLIARHQVTHTLLLPSLYSVLLEHAPLQQLQSLNTVMVAGEACSSALVKLHFQQIPFTNLFNEYGPTEGTVWCTAHQIQAEDAQRAVPIGRPIPYVENYILDEQLQPVPVGVVGELYVGGAGVAKGYLHRPEQTAKKFLTHPFRKDEGERIYKTGDLARYRANGVIDFLGRADQQVKIRGFRIELDGIREVLLQYPPVNDALIVVQKEKNVAGQIIAQRLLAYVLPEGDLDQSDLSSFLKQSLPNYMLPSATIVLDEFPRLPNGKVNRAALPSPKKIDLATDRDYVAPETDLEKQLLSIWESVLQKEKIGIQDNFFAIGGDSILSIQIIAQARKAELNIRPDQLYDHQTVAALAKAIEQSDRKENTSTLIEMPEQRAYPLNQMQQALLMHHLRAEVDEGFLQLNFTLRATLDKELFQDAWREACQRHLVMRSAIDWTDRSVPALVVEDHVDLPWTFYDWRKQSVEEQVAALAKLNEDDRKLALDLTKAPVARMSLIQLAENRYYLSWTCHHILLDGWSGGIVLKDVLHLYHAKRVGQIAPLEPLPSYATYLSWLGRQNEEVVQQFWQAHFKGYTQAQLLAPSSERTGPSITFQDHHFHIDAQQSEALRQWGREKRIALPTLLQALWALLLGKQMECNDVTFGVTVSGRFVQFPGIELMTGLFMNVLPNRISWSATTTIDQWLQALQSHESKVRPFEYVTESQIKEWINWPKSTELFDSLFVFGNFLKDGLAIGEIEIEDFAGDFTSNYPLTLRVNPLAEIAFDLRFDAASFSPQQIQWLEKEMRALVAVVLEGANQNVQQLVDQIAALPLVSAASADVQQVTIVDEEQSYLAPRNPIELALSKIWEKLLGRHPIGVRDPFFEIGGRSILAIQLFAAIEKEFGQSLPVVSLFEHPTIEALAQLLENKTSGLTWSSLVPLKITGERKPLFCFHAGGGHVFFYKALAQHIHPEQPIYALQPKGGEGEQSAYASIEAMAADYISEIRSVQEKGPYHLLGTCFSNAVGLEVANQLQASGEEVAELFIVDSGPRHLVPVSPNGERKTVRRFANMLRNGDWQGITKKLNNRWKRRQKKRRAQRSDAEMQLFNLVDSLNQMYKKYTWKAFAGKITFIRSQEFADRPDKKFHLEQWNKLAEKGLDIHVVPGHHISLFEEPEVEGLAEQLDACLQLEESI
ncbi:MAG: amino acid adenylation domain-containing protein [Bacteroidota bacterium]